MDTVSTKHDVQGKKTYAAMKKPTVLTHVKKKKIKKEEFK